MKTQVKFKSGLNTSEDVFLDNTRANIEKYGHLIPTYSTKKALICGGGPSLEDWIEEIRDLKDAGWTIFALNGVAKYLYEEHQIISDWQLVIDARPENIEFIGDFWAENIALGSQVDPSLFEAAIHSQSNVIMVHCMAVKGSLDLIRELHPGNTVLGGGSTVGMMAMNFISSAGYAKAKLYGFDSSHREDKKHPYTQPLNEDQPVIDFIFRGRSFKSSGPMASQAQQFITYWKVWANKGLEFDIRGDGLLPTMWRYVQAIEEFGSTEDRELIKYEKVWRMDNYRKYSPGEDFWDHYQHHIPRDAKTVADFGCGTGRIVSKINELGPAYIGIDHATNCLDDEAKDLIDQHPNEFIPANLWQFKGRLFDFGLCCDVMEHIPAWKMDDTLQAIARSVRVGAVFTICCAPDVFGERVGETLHMNVMPPDQWADKIKSIFGFAEIIHGDGPNVVILAKKEPGQ